MLSRASPVPTIGCVPRLYGFQRQQDNTHTTKHSQQMVQCNATAAHTNRAYNACGCAGDAEGSKMLTFITNCDNGKQRLNGLRCFARPNNFKIKNPCTGDCRRGPTAAELVMQNRFWCDKPPHLKNREKRKADSEHLPPAYAQRPWLCRWLSPSPHHLRCRAGVTWGRHLRSCARAVLPSAAGQFNITFEWESSRNDGHYPCFGHKKTSMWQDMRTRTA